MPEPNLSFWETELKIEDFGKNFFFYEGRCVKFFQQMSICQESAKNEGSQKSQTVPDSPVQSQTAPYSPRKSQLVPQRITGGPREA